METLQDFETVYPKIRGFKWDHLPEHLKVVSQPFGELALTICKICPQDPETADALEALLIAKDAAVRAVVYAKAGNLAPLK